MSLSYRHLGGDTPLFGATIPAHLAEITALYPGQDAVVSRAQGRRLSYAELDQAVARLARGLLGLGFARGERIGIWATNNLEWLLLQLATARIGAVLVNINPAYRSGELAYALRRSEVSALFLIPAFRSSDYLAMLAELLPELAGAATPDGWHNDALPALRRVVLYDPETPRLEQRPLSGLTLWHEVLAAADAVPPAELDARTAALDRDDPINIQYTSGTTGAPKAVVLSHHNILNNAVFSAGAIGFGAGDRLCIPVPFYHCFGMVLSNLLALGVGGCAVIPGAYFTAAEVLDAVEAEQCTALHGVPTMFIALLEEQARQPRRVDTLRTGIMAGAPCPAPLLKRVMGELHCADIRIGYGQTEASPLTHLTRAGDSLERRTETVGTNLPHQEVKVVSTEDGSTVACGEVGEVCFRGHHVMRGYYADAEATAKAIDPAGWLHSGDLGTLDEEGYLRITGRLKEMIIRGGENIYPVEIEALLFAHPKVAQVAVFGIPDDYYGEQVMAWVQLQPGAQIDEAELKAWCRERMAHFKVPKWIWIVDEFPMTVTGKLQKFRMRELALERMGVAPPPTA